MTREPVIVELRTGKAMFHGTLAGISALLLFGVGVLGVFTGGMEGQTIFLGGVTVLILGAISAHYIGIALRKPVALRMDAHGISGYYAEPAVWPEIMEISAFDGSKGARYLGFAFLNPETIRARQSAWRKFSAWSRNPHYRYQIVISQELLLDSEVETLAALARAFQREV